MPRGKRKGKGKKPVEEKSNVSTEGLQDQSCGSKKPVEEKSNVSTEGLKDQSCGRELPLFENRPMLAEEWQDIAHEDEADKLKQLKDEIKIELPDRMALNAKLPPKQAPGKLGKKIKLISNWFPIELLPDGNIYHYDVKIIDKKRSVTSDLSTLGVDKKVPKYRCLSTKLNRKVISEMLQTDDFKNSFAVYDGQNNLYASTLLKLKFPYETKVVIEDDRREDSTQIRESDVFKVQIKPVEKKDENKVKTKSCAINLEPLHELFAGRTYDIQNVQEAVMALETIFRHTPAFKFVPIGRSFFNQKFNLENMHPLIGGVEIWFGYHQSLCLGQWKPMINLNMTATTFFSKGSLLKYYNSNIESSIKMNKELKNVEIKVTHQPFPRKYRIVRLTKKSADDIKFKNDKNIDTTVHEYFKERYKKRLEYPNYPCVQVKPEKKNIYFPIEVCEISEGQHYRTQLDSKNQSQTELDSKNQSQMIKVTAQAPTDRFRRIKDIREKYANYEQDECLNQFNIRVKREPMHVDGRVLEAPTVNYYNDKFQPKNGSWDIRFKKFIEGSKISSWCLLSLAKRENCSIGNLEYFSTQLCKISKAAGIEIDKPFDIAIVPKEKILDKLVENKKINLTVIVIPFKDKSLYRKVKQIAEVELGIITQCVSHTSITKCNPSLLSNLCQKINAKMGGINHVLSRGEIPKVMEKPVIIMGADVSHASVTDKDGLSIAAVVGSLCKNMVRFAVTCKLQKNENKKKKSLEIILGLKNMVKDLLKAFYRYTRLKPEKIIFYRDGVSEGQFVEVKEKEVKYIRDACRDLEKEYEPKITYAVVQKRHHTRFIPENIRDGVGTTKNIPPGTVVDTTVVNPLHRDFYLCSQNGLKGTSRPGHYTMIEDDNEFSSDDFQKLTYYLCHTFVRCTKSISCPAPVRYAHLAAMHTRLYLPNKEMADDRSESSGSSKTLAESDEISAELLKAIKIPNEIKHAMYYV